MAGYGAFQFASPSQYGDWAQYAGLDRTTGETVPQPAPQQGVAPPEDLQGYMNQRLGSAQQKMAAIPATFQQVGQGNVIKAAGMIRGAGALAADQSSAPQASTPTAGYDYTFGLD